VRLTAEAAAIAPYYYIRYRLSSDSYAQPPTARRGENDEAVSAAVARRSLRMLKNTRDLEKLPAPARSASHSLGTLSVGNVL